MKTLTIIDFFKRKVSNNLKINISGIILPNINVEENFNIPIKKNPNEPVEENLNILINKTYLYIEKNSTSNFRS